MDYDLTVIGGGPGGYHAAIRGAQRGLKVALVEKKGLGGTCLHRGCIPSKAYIAAAQVVSEAARAEKMGVSFGRPAIDFAKMVAWKGEKVSRLAQGLQELVKANGVELIAGEGTVSEKSGERFVVQVGTAKIESRFLILAGGTEPVRPNGFPFDGKRVITTDELFEISKIPRKMLIVGGGVIGCEIACAFQLLGVEVTLAEMLPDLLAEEDRIVSRTLKRLFEKRGITVRVGQPVTPADLAGPFDLVLVAVGRRAALEKMGLDRFGIQTEGGKIVVNNQMETTCPGVYAIGDLTGKTLLAHGAMAEGICAAEAIVGNEAPVAYEAIPRVTYTLPEVAAVGRREEDLKKSGVRYRTGRFPYAACGKALCHEEEEGFCQVYSDEEGRLLGGLILGAHASDLIAPLSLLIQNRLPVSALVKTVHAHPSFSEIVHEAVEDLEGMAIHKVGRR